MADGDNKVYVFDDGANKHEGMTKSEIMDTIVEMMETGQVTGGIYIDAVKEQNAGESLKFWVGTQAQYEALPEIDPYIDYKITDANTLQEIDAALTQLKEQLTSGAFKVKSAYTADDVKTSINGKAISEIFESDGKTAKKATIATADENGNNIMASYALKDDLQDAEGDIDALEGRMTTAEGDIDALEAEQQTNAKLTQVVTKDNSTNAISATIDAAKYFLRNKQVSTGAVAIGTTGWYRIAKLPTYSSSRITVTKQYNYGRGVSLILDVAVGADNTEDATTNIVASYAGMRGQSNYIDKIRYKHAGSGQVYIDVHITSDGNQNSYWLAYDGTSAYAGAFTSSDFALYPFQQTSDTGGTELPMPEDTGLATTGTIYQQGAPVFATDPTKLEPSTANGWTQTTATGALPSVGVYMVAPNASIGSYGIGVMFYAADRTVASAIGAAGSAMSLFYIPTSSLRWALRSDNGTTIQLTDVHYKRIA